MRHSESKYLSLLLICLFAATSVVAGPVLRQLNILVELHDNGDADITELREMSIDNVGTESYIVIGNLAGSDIRDFSVSDEKGNTYTYEESWDIHRSREQKAGRCGIVSKGDGYELCWGLGDSGERVYTIRYTVTNLVRSYNGTDGFNFMFVARNIKPSPQKATVTITAPEMEQGFPYDSIRIWSFGYHGRIDKVDGDVVATTSEPMTPESSMIVMMELEKGILHPEMSESGRFDEVREEAFKGSNYEEKKTNVFKFIWDNFVALAFGLFVILLMIWAIWHKLSVKRARKELERDLNWYRDIPLDGDLARANSMLQGYEVFSEGNQENLISAMVLRMIRTGTLRIENHYIAPTGFKKLFGREGKNQDCIVIGNFNPNNRLLKGAPMKLLYDFFSAAAGDDRILQPKELRYWMGNHRSEVMMFLKTLQPTMSLKDCKRELEEVKKVFGLKKFLEDFTLANERHLSEVALWNDYLVYATLFGIGEQVMRDMKQLNPEFLNMSEITRNMTNRNILPNLMAATYIGTRDVEKAMSRSSGGGGSSSFGGGGGFRGGGSGGGVR